VLIDIDKAIQQVEVKLPLTIEASVTVLSPVGNGQEIAELDVDFIYCKTKRVMYTKTFKTFANLYHYIEETFND